MFKFQRLGGAVALLIIMAAFGYAQSSIMLWNAGPNLQFARDSAGAAITANGNIYVLGGNSTVPTSVETLAPGASLWTNAVSLQTPRIGNCAISSGSIIFLTGGKDSRRAIRDLTSYNPAGPIGNVKSMLTGRYLHACAVDAFGRINVIGGKDVAEVPTATVERFSGKAWLPMAPLPEARFNFAAASDRIGNILTFGGSTATNTATNTVNRFNGVTWDTVAPMPIATSGSAVVAGANKLIYVIGGNDGSGPINAVQIYHIASDSWTIGTPLPVAVSNASAVIDTAGKVIVIGGIDATNRNVSAVWTSGQESAPPIINSFPNTFTRVGSPYSYQATSTGNPAATYSLTFAPAGMTIDSTSGIISWTPDITQVGVQNVTVTATNLAGSNDQSFAINVLFAVPPAPTGFTISNITANGASLSWNPLAPELGAATYNLYQVFFSGRGGPRYILLAGDMTTTLANVGGLAAGSNIRYVVTSVVNGVESPRTSQVFLVTLIPGSPTNVIITSNTQNTIALSWTAPATSQVPIVGYRIFESTSTGLLLRVDNITDTFATVTGLLPNTIHLFYVVSFDTNGNQSFPTLAPTVTTATTPTLFHNSAFPRAVGGGFYAESLVAVIGDSLMLISTEAHSSAGVNYVISSSGLPTSTFSLVTAPAGMTIDPVTGVVTWTPVSGPVGAFTATARGTNSQGFSDFNFTYTVYPAGTDLLSPSTVLMFQAVASNVTQTSATITWNPSTDNVGVAGYRIYAVSPILICGTRVGCPILPNIVPIAVTSGTGTTVTLNNLTPNSGYSYWIEAFDAAGNTSFITQGIQRNFFTLP